MEDSFREKSIKGTFHIFVGNRHQICSQIFIKPSTISKEEQKGGITVTLVIDALKIQYGKNIHLGSSYPFSEFQDPCLH